MWPKRFFLNFHGLGEPARKIDSGERPYWVAPSLFEQALDLIPEIARRGVTLELTFDDGNLSDFTHAFPLLVERGRVAQFFVLAGRIGTPGSLSESQILEMAEAGMPIGSHGWDHIALPEADSGQLSQELNGSKAKIEDILGQAVTSLAIPFGLFNKAVIEAAQQAGYQRIYTSSGGYASATQGLIPRTSAREGFEPNRDLAKLTSLKVRLDSAIRDPLRRLRYSG